MGFDSRRIDDTGEGVPALGKGKLVCRLCSLMPLGNPLPDVDPVRVGFLLKISGTLETDS